MFSHLVLLKRSPWFIYSVSEDDACQTASHYKTDLVGIVKTKGQYLEVLAPTTKVVLQPVHIKQITECGKAISHPTDDEDEHDAELECALNEDVPNDEAPK